MSTLYIIRGINYGQSAHDADIGTNNILAMGKYMNVANAKRFMAWDTHIQRCLMNGQYGRIGLYDDKGIICTNI